MIGICAAIGASLAWSYSCFIWRINSFIISPIRINLLKNIIAIGVFSPSLLTINLFQDIKYILILITSGIIGIGLGDTFYIKSLKLIGTRKTLSIEALGPLIAALSGVFFLKENLSLTSWIGIAIVSVSLFKILLKDKIILINNPDNTISTSNFKSLIYPILSIICAVIAALLSRKVFLETNLNPFETTEIRLFGAIIFLLIATKFEINLSLANIKRKDKLTLLFSIILGTNIGILLQQIVFKTLPLGIGWTLLSTSPIFSLIFTEKEEGKLSFETIITTIILCCGIGLTII